MVTRILNAWAVLELVEIMGVGSDTSFAQYGGAEAAMKSSLYNWLGRPRFFGSVRQTAAGAILGPGTRSSALA